MHHPLGIAGRAKKRTGFFTIVPLLLLACTAEEEVLPEDASPAEYYRRDPLALERGRALYEGSCASFCHEVEGDSAVDLFDCDWRHGSSDEQLFAIISEGVANTRMVGFGENFPEGAEDTWRIVAYLRDNQAQCPTDAETALSE